ncbi:MAG: 26S proteasome regulatory subunit [Sclerophora amabilis]|nr:MAG: 26S proteasome regulatory subunit [Sclerophora amabilis]
MNNDKISDLLVEWRDATPPNLQHYFISFEDYWERKLWHQLTDSILEYFGTAESEPQRLPMYHDFVLAFAGKLNQLKLVRIGLSASTQIEDRRACLNFTKDLAALVNKPESQDGYVFACSAASNILLELTEVEEARRLLDDSQRILDSFDSVENIVHASFYQANSEYYRVRALARHVHSQSSSNCSQVKAQFGPYYRNSLLYLACIDVDKLAWQPRETRAYQLCLAALISDEIYNFGELLLHPILDSLINTQHAWLRDLLFAFNRGDLAAYDVLAGNISKNQLLDEHKLFLYQKISLAALTEAVFKRPSHERAMMFSAISAETKVQPDEIEHLLMKAFSLGLLRGSIDQVDGVADIKWVQPKVLDKKQIESMRLRLKQWDSNVNNLGTWIEGVGQDVWAA